MAVVANGEEKVRPPSGGHIERHDGGRDGFVWRSCVLLLEAKDIMPSEGGGMDGRRRDGGEKEICRSVARRVGEECCHRAAGAGGRSWPIADVGDGDVPDSVTMYGVVRRIDERG